MRLPLAFEKFGDSCFACVSETVRNRLSLDESSKSAERQRCEDVLSLWRYGGEVIRWRIAHLPLHAMFQIPVITLQLWIICKSFAINTWSCLTTQFENKALEWCRMSGILGSAMLSHCRCCHRRECEYNYSVLALFCLTNICGIASKNLPVNLNEPTLSESFRPV